MRPVSGHRRTGARGSAQLRNGEGRGHDLRPAHSERAGGAVGETEGRTAVYRERVRLLAAPVDPDRDHAVRASGDTHVLCCRERAGDAIEHRLLGIGAGRDVDGDVDPFAITALDMGDLIAVCRDTSRWYREEGELVVGRRDVDRCICHEKSPFDRYRRPKRSRFPWKTGHSCPTLINKEGFPWPGFSLSL